jgi:transposase
LCRELRTLISERVRHANRIRGVLFTQGVGDCDPRRPDRRARLEALQTGDGRSLPRHLKAMIARELDVLELLNAQINQVRAERDALVAAEVEAHVEGPALSMLLDLTGIGPGCAGVLWSEGFLRPFSNRRQLAAYAGLAPTPWQSGTINHEQGVSKAGNPRLRAILVEMAWLWLRHQPGSALARWYHDRVQRSGGRMKKVAIIALARKLLVALWKYVTAGVVIEGAAMTRA